jgi:hypothetical protein
MSVRCLWGGRAGTPSLAAADSRQTKGGKKPLAKAWEYLVSRSGHVTDQDTGEPGGGTVTDR